jgi:hypothetical protein
MGARRNMARTNSALIAVLGLALAGCSYTADVRNTSAAPVFVQMVQVDAIQPDWVLASARIAPGEYAKLGPARVPFQRVMIDVGDQSEKSVNARTRIRVGTTKLDVGTKPSPEPDREEVVYTLERRPE